MFVSKLFLEVKGGVFGVAESDKIQTVLDRMEDAGWDIRAASTVINPGETHITLGLGNNRPKFIKVREQMIGLLQEAGFTVRQGRTLVARILDVQHMEPHVASGGIIHQFQLNPTP